MDRAPRHFQRILLKVSGDAFCKEDGQGIDIDEVRSIAEQAKEVLAFGKQLAVVIGGGNILRGATMAVRGINRATADYMGMLATIINALALQDQLERTGVETRILSAIEMHQVAEPFIRRRAIRHLEKDRVVILAGGTGNPFFTTDTTAALRAKEIGADILMKATKVDGVYDKDPHLHPDAVRFEHLDYLAVLNRKLKVMDSTAISLCMDNHLGILVFNLKTPGNIVKAANGEPIGTLIAAAPEREATGSQRLAAVAGSEGTKGKKA
ncbi:MAG: UMP kinase [Planctomycetes bacterium]|nr:UMP kinase [Planctomycetota bacterium]